MMGNLGKLLEEIDKYSIEEFGHQKMISTEKAMQIIRSHMENEPVSNPNKLNDGWIPVEERLPDPGVYLVSCDDKDYPVKRMRMKGICFYDHEGIYDGKVYAWRSLPEPYQPKEEKQ